MNQSTLSVRVDSIDKRKFETFCDEAGLNVSTAINMFVKYVIREKELPFMIRSESFREEIDRKILEAEREMENNPKTYTSKEVFDELKKI